MINLLPAHAKRVVKREHWLRLFAVLCLASSFASLVLLLMSIPTWMMLNYQTVGEDNDQNSINEIAAERARAEKELAETQRIIEHLKSKSNTKSHTAIIESLDDIGGAEIAISQFNFDAKNKLVLIGVAATRADLSSFRYRVEKSSYFTAVDLPLASLVQETEAAFTMTLTLK